MAVLSSAKGGVNMPERIAFTGHRFLKWKDVHDDLVLIHGEFPEAIWITGGAVGLDSSAAAYAMLHGIELWLILPFSPKVMTAKWSEAQARVLTESVKYARKFSVLAPVYEVSVYQRRNERMVDLATMLAAFYRGSPGGTANCMKYAMQVGREIRVCR